MKFIYLADTHIGGSDVQGYRQQERYLRYVNELFHLLSEWLNQHPEVLFLIHGGDLVDDGTPENILLTRDLFATLPLPCYLSLGNHDLTCANSLSQWLQLAPDFFPQRQADYSLMREDIRLDFLCAQWGNKPCLWDPSEEQIPTFTDQQLALLRNGLEGKRRILITHAPPCGLPATQTGLQNPLHPPAGNFQTVLENLAKELKLDLILGAHNHMDLAVKSDPAFFVTTAAFTETPFEFKLFEITKDILSMCTLDLVNQLPFRSHYDHQKGYVQGRPCDRGFHEKRKLSEPPR
ncbi:MAG: metallophosphoesterase [Lentisphaeria bacterium]